MNFFRITGVLLSGLSVAVAAETTPSAITLQTQAQALIAPFAEQLMHTVKQAMAEGGPEQAILACQVQAPAIAEQHSQSPWRVGRTALKVRNPDNQPDAWERQVLEQFATAANQGQPIASLKHGEIVDGEYRYMQAIGTAEPCLACHGTNIEAKTAAIIDQQYPMDQARGFTLGELRGAFTLRRTLAEIAQ
ncbi:MAG: Tll0287-like domain-containing protein [Pseudomonas sp.]